MGRSACCEKVGLKKGPWTPEEDHKLMAYIKKHGCGSWRALPPRAGLKRCGKSCRLRWINYLRPDIKRGKFSLQEEQTIIQLHALLGNRWSAIAAHVPNRTDNEIKNYWNTHLKKRLSKMGIDPISHKPKTDIIFGSNNSQYSKDAANLSHMAQWENARLEAEARLVRESKKLQFSDHNNKFGSSLPSKYHHQQFNNILPLQTKVVPPFLDILKVWQGENWIKPKTTKDMYSSTSSLLLDSYFTCTNNFESPTSSNNLFMVSNINNNSIPGLVDNSCLVNAGSANNVVTKKEVQINNDISSTYNMSAITDDEYLENIVGSCKDNNQLLEDDNNKFSYWNTILNSCTDPAP